MKHKAIVLKKMSNTYHLYPAISAPEEISALPWYVKKIRCVMSKPQPLPLMIIPWQPLVCLIYNLIYFSTYLPKILIYKAKSLVLMYKSADLLTKSKNLSSVVTSVFVFHFQYCRIRSLQC